MVERHVAAVGDDPVDELDVARRRGQRDVALLEDLLDVLGMRLDLLVEDVVGGDRDHAGPPAGAAEILGVGVGADGVPRQVAEERLEVRDEGAVDVVRQDDQVRPLGVHQVDDLLDRLREEGTGRRIARIDEEERLDLRILQRLQVLVRELEAVLLLGADENRL